MANLPRSWYPPSHCWVFCIYASEYCLQCAEPACFTMHACMHGRVHCNSAGVTRLKCYFYLPIAFEFVSGNAPHHMQAPLMGILFMMRGLGYFVAGSVVLSQADTSKPEFWCYFCGETEKTANSVFAYFVMLLLLCFCAVLFIWVYASKSLKFSIRAEEEYEKMRESVFMQRCRH